MSMGVAATPFPLTDGLDAVWGYEPSHEAMAHLLRDVFACDGSSIDEDLVEMRYRASIRPGHHERFSALSRRRGRGGSTRCRRHRMSWAGMAIPTLLIHGRDDKVIPVSSSQQLAEQIPGPVWRFSLSAAIGCRSSEQKISAPWPWSSWENLTSTASSQRGSGLPAHVPGQQETGFRSTDSANAGEQGRIKDALDTAAGQLRRKP